ncbi:unnamed protein product [Echinostoma caproni]|uniref:SLC12 domain-containing protein n=1 Tax=Echinostoma caproni TaxID=27848 RepID=A0A183A8B9_9TREM|nr:unnamed protein product [Echinostoma caproni]
MYHVFSSSFCSGFFDQPCTQDVLQDIWTERKSLNLISSHSHYNVVDSVELIPANGRVRSRSSSIGSGSLSSLPQRSPSPNELREIQLSDLGTHGESDELDQLVENPRRRMTPGEYMNVVLSRHFDRVVFDDTLSGLQKVRQYFRSWRTKSRANLDVNNNNNTNSDNRHQSVGGNQNPGFTFAVHHRDDIEDSGIVHSTSISSYPPLGPHYHPNKLIRVGRSRSPYFDIWPFNLFALINLSQSSITNPISTVNPTELSSMPGELSYELDRTGLFLLQLACLVARSPSWRKRRYPPQLRVFFPLLGSSDRNASGETVDSAPQMAYLWLSRLLNELRITAAIQLVTLERFTSTSGAGMDANKEDTTGIRELNQFILSNCHPDTTALFVYLPRPPEQTGSDAAQLYLKQLDMLTENLPPTLLAHGLHDVTSTAL